MIHLKLYEQFHNDKLPIEFKELKDIALKFNNPEDFSKSLNYNELGHDREKSFLGERYLRLNRGYTLDEIDEFNSYDMNESITVYRTGDSPIKWGDYVYIDYTNAKQALDAGQGYKIYKLDTTYGDLIYATQGSGEFFYSPKYLREYSGDTLQDFWNKVNNIQYIEHSAIKTDVETTFKEKVIDLIHKSEDWEDFESDYYILANTMNENPFQFDIDEMWYDEKNT